MDLIVSKFADKQKDLLELEKRAQLDTQAECLAKLTKQQLQKRGIALLNLRESSRRTGLAGKILIEYVGGFENQLPNHQIKVGDVVRVEKGGSAKESSSELGDERSPVSGIVSSVKSDCIAVAFKEDLPAGWKEGLRMVKLTNEVAFKRMLKAMDDLKAVAQRGSHESILKVAFGQASNSPRDEPSTDFDGIGEAKFYNKNLNASQKAAVARSVGPECISLIHGPPGTGKTETLVEVIKQFAKPTIGLDRPQRPPKILVCGPSNLSVDNLVERLGRDPRFSILRLGHPARILEHVLHHSLDYRMIQGDNSGLAKDIRKEIDGLLSSLEKARGAERRQIYGQLKDLRKELRDREKKSLDDIFRQTQIVLCTLNMAGSKQLEGKTFDIAIVDEGSQALEAECWIPILLQTKKTVLAGDHQQLPPTVTSVLAAEKGLSRTLFTRLVEASPGLVSMLRVQYRMHKDIMDWASAAMYRGKLIADKSVADHRLSDIVPGLKDEPLASPFVLIDTAGMGMRESVAEDADSTVESRCNAEEAKLAISHVKFLLKAGLEPSLCAIITPYNGQVDLLMAMREGDPQLLAKVEVGTVDSFQGREKEAIVISMVRSNEEGDIGFLQDVRRTNVAITRARRHACVIGDSATLSRHPFYKNLIAYIEQSGYVDYPSA